MLYLQWFDDSKRPTPLKLADAVAAYVSRFDGAQPNTILVNEADAGATYPGCQVQVEKRIGPNNFQVGRME